MGESRPTPPPAVPPYIASLDPDTKGREGSKVQPEAVPGEGSVAPEAAAEPEGAVQADRAALTESSRAPPPLEDR